MVMTDSAISKWKTLVKNLDYFLKSFIVLLISLLNLPLKVAWLRDGLRDNWR